MPRKAFVADLQEATKIFERINVSQLKAGEEDGMIKFLYHMSDGDATEITVLVPGKWTPNISRHGGPNDRNPNTKSTTRKLLDGVH